jgi:hypothetical protein
VRRASCGHGSSEQRAARAEYANVYRSDCWEQSTPQQIGRTYQTTRASSQEDPEAARAEKRMRDELLQAPTPSATPTAPVDTQPPTPTRTVEGTEVTAVGDSVMLAAAPELQTAFPGIAINAEVSRQPRSAPQLLEQVEQAGQLRQIAVLGLGTNGYWGTGTLERVLDIIGPGRKLVLVTAYAAEPWVPSVNTYDIQITASHPGQVAIADWATAIGTRTSLLGPDHVHPGAAGEPSTPKPSAMPWPR